MSRDGFTRREALQLLGSGLLLVSCGPVAPPPGATDGAKGYDWTKHYWGYAVDTTRCIGCCACMRACRAENDVPPGYFRTWVERYEVSVAGEVRVDVARGDDYVFGETGGDVSKAFFVPKLCNHCERSVCNQVCPVGAAYATKDGVVLVDPKRCIGCGYCVQACPYGSRFINPRSHTADKCTWCYHRITRGLLPACVQACPTGARRFGDLKQEDDPVRKIIATESVRVLQPELLTEPHAFYLGLDREVR